ncbi:hypothetical protein THAOC_21061 [Thalassiosira oceanica]|uniref:Uncharacterized protein n=1 Tax=Thalassiosira oceanica TaxID=159749 RepID=K0SCW8_THAOC|nr:hypothetical protein THAOC_21061 [Thalassiosira oceanica]|eukprot:EJK58786.1 hypothetical protein THAOC_21061 [Thalassiosira oceanica]
MPGLREDEAPASLMAWITTKQTKEAKLQRLHEAQHQMNHMEKLLAQSRQENNDNAKQLAELNDWGKNNERQAALADRHEAGGEDDAPASLMAWIAAKQTKEAKLQRLHEAQHQMNHMEKLLAQSTQEINNNAKQLAELNDWGKNNERQAALADGHEDEADEQTAMGAAGEGVQQEAQQGQPPMHESGSVKKQVRTCGLTKQLGCHCACALLTLIC